MWFAPYTPFFVAPQTRSRNVVRFIHTTSCCATNTLVKCGSLHTRRFSSRQKHARGMWFASYTPLFVAPQSRPWNVVRLIHATFCRATNTPVDVVRFIYATFRRATYTIVECSSPHTHHFSSRNKYDHGKGLYISIRVRPSLIINVLRLKQSKSNNTSQSSTK